eukprot:TRINITY_DN29509_c0_g1_i1.p1 TRINITY_DN29509_c0_g1~~TRINITY_DN29509_c0_g1_i1.p1  ORF type:complete len:340 (-),score=32.96 TRINITY_DN29509_c0_g1_i1:292-1311(-)
MTFPISVSALRRCPLSILSVTMPPYLRVSRLSTITATSYLSQLHPPLSLRRPHVRCLSSGSSEEQSTEAARGRVSLVQGASRGIGLEFVRQLLARHPGEQVVATCRRPEQAEELSAMQRESGGRLTVLPLDVMDEDTIRAAAEAVKAIHGKLNLVVNTAGILHIAGKMQPETSLSKVDPEALLMTYRVNAMGPILVLKHMAALLKEGGGGVGGGRASASKDGERGQRPSVVANISARVGSIGDNGLGGWYSYRASKTALNQLTKTASVELARKRDPIVCLLLHPGTVDTGLSKPFQRNVPEGKLFTPQRSVESLLRIIESAELKDNGKFFAWDGTHIPW